MGIEGGGGAAGDVIHALVLALEQLGKPGLELQAAVELGLEAQQRGAGVVGATANILGWIESAVRDAIAAGIATVHQHLAMIPLMSVSRNFFMGNEPVKKVAGISFFDHEFANRVTMEEMRKMGINLRGPDQAVGTLSGGERQTVAISRAVHFGAKVLILDEPLTGLDPVQRRHMIALFHRLGDEGRCVLVSSHVLDEVAKIGSRVLVIAQGRLVASGDYRDLRELMDDPVRRADLGGQGRDTVRREFTDDAMARRTLEVYRRYLK